jgi:hypothetical protein
LTSLINLSHIQDAFLLTVNKFCLPNCNCSDEVVFAVAVVGDVVVVELVLWNQGAVAGDEAGDDVTDVLGLHFLC